MPIHISGSKFARTSNPEYGGMSEAGELIRKIETRINALEQRLLLLKNENQELRENCDLLKRELADSKQSIANLEKEKEVLKMARNLTSAEEGDSSQAKDRIGALVREIDKCIALLNK